MSQNSQPQLGASDLITSSPSHTLMASWGVSPGQLGPGKTLFLPAALVGLPGTFGAGLKQSGYPDNISLQISIGLAYIDGDIY